MTLDQPDTQQANKQKLVSDKPKRKFKTYKLRTFSDEVAQCQDKDNGKRAQENEHGIPEPQSRES